MKKTILGLDLGTNSIGWALAKYNFDIKEGEILGLGSRIIPMDAKQMSDFSTGQTISVTADRTTARSMRRLYQRRKLRRERLHRVLNILGFLPIHYANDIDFENKLGQFKKNKEPKLAYKKDNAGKFNFIFQDAFNEMVEEFKDYGQDIKLPYDWTLYYLRKKALYKRISKEELAWVLLSFNQKRGYYQSRDEVLEDDSNKLEEYYKLKVASVEEGDKAKGGTWYNVILENEWIYRRKSKEPLFSWIGKEKEFIVTTTLDKDGNPKKDSEGDVKRSFRAVDSEKDWIAIKKKTENEIKNSGEEVGEYIYNNLLKDPTQKIRGKLVKTIDRKYYKKELEKILKTQLEYYPEFQDKNILQDCINELYKHNEAHKRNLSIVGTSTIDRFRFLLVEDILFYHRPLKSQKSTITNCPFESRVFNKDGERMVRPIKCISKSHPFYIEFRLWQFVHNLRIYQREATINNKPVIDHDVTDKYLNDEDNDVALYDFLNQRKEIKQSVLLGHFGLNEKGYRWNYVEDKSYPCNELRSDITKHLSKVEGVNPEEYINDKFVLNLWHIIYSVRDLKQYSKALKTFAEKNNIGVDGFHDAFIKIKPSESDYGAFSEKAIKKLLPLMRIGKYWNENNVPVEVKFRMDSILKRLEAIKYDPEKIENVSDDDIPKQVLKSFISSSHPYRGLNTYQASYAVYDRHAEVSKVTRWVNPNDISKYLNGFKQHSLRNPVVEQVVTETLRMVREIWEYYGKGKEGYFSEIHVELGRDMKNDKNTRERISKTINDNTNTNERIKNILQELMDDDSIEGSVRPYSKGHQEILKLYEEGVYTRSLESYKDVSIDEIEDIRGKVSPTKSEINRYKLWMQQGYISPYTGEVIQLSKLFTTAYEVEHIIPRSRYFDDSLSNKVICEAEINPYPYKGNKTAYRFIKDRGGSIVPELSKNGKQVSVLPLDKYEVHCKTYFNDNKKKLELLLSEDVPEGFISRQLNDSRYISKVVKGLLSNVVREEGEQEATSKNLVPVVGRITSELKKDWGLDDIWDDLLTPRFERMNEITDTKDFRIETTDGHGNRYMINTVPDELAKGFTKKRLDHRHHALDALVVACTTKEHTNLLNNKFANSKNKRYDLKEKLSFKSKPDAYGNYKWQYYKPWSDFTQNAKEVLERTIVSFKQNKRVINRATNKYNKWKEIDGKMKKVQVEQKGQNWAIRKSLHKAFYYGKINGVETPRGKIATARRVLLSDINSMKKLESITDTGIQKILKNHLKNYVDEKGKFQFKLAFDADGVNDLNKNIKNLNDGKPHQPIYKVRVYEIGSKFPLGYTGNNNSKYVEADKGTNLFFNIYWDEKKQKRNYETVPLNEVIAHQKMVANLPRQERTETPTKPELGKFLFSLSPDDLVYVPTDDEMENPHLFDFIKLSQNQFTRIYKMVSTTQDKLQCQPMTYAKEIKKNEVGTNNKSQRILGYPKHGNILDEKGKLCMIKERCWKLKTDRLGNIQKMIK